MIAREGTKNFIFQILFVFVLFYAVGCSNILFNQIENDVAGAKICNNFEIVSSQRTAEKTGFHRLLRTNVDFNSNGEGDKVSKVLLRQVISEDFFVDKYEVEELFRFEGKTQVLMNNTIDLEKPAYLSTPHLLQLLVNPTRTEKGLWRAEWEIPFHYRYQLPGSNYFVSKSIQPPEVLIQTSDRQWCILEQSTRQIPSVSLHIPIGHIGDEFLVTFLTLLCTTLSSLFIIYTLFKKKRTPRSR